MSRDGMRPRGAATAALAVAAAATAALAALYVIRRRRSRYTDTNEGGASSASTPDARAKQEASTPSHPETEAVVEAMFQHACSRASSLADNAVSPQDRLMLYGLYKQSTVGDRNIKEPSKLNLVSHAKYMAWGKFAGMPRPVAMVKYVEVVQHFDQLGGMGSGIGSGGVAPEMDNDDIVYSKEDEYDSDEIEESEEELKEKEGSQGKRLSATGVHHSIPMPLALGENKGDDSPSLGEISSPDGRLLKAAVSGDIDALRSALDDGALSSHADSSGQTALHFAADKGHGQCLDLLLERGADPNAADAEGISVLQAAVIGGNVEVSKKLLEAGADPDKEDIDGDSPRSCADDSGDEEMIALFQ